MPSGLTTSQPYSIAGVATDEVNLVFDRYDVATSLKEATRERRQAGKPMTSYHVADNTPVGKMSVKQFLTSAKTKDELTVYLSKKALRHFKDKPKVFIVTSRQEVLSNSMDAQHLCSSQEEADTRIILHSLDVSRRGAAEHVTECRCDEVQQCQVTECRFSHLTPMSLCLQSTATMSSAGTHTSSLLWGT